MLLEYITKEKGVACYLPPLQTIYNAVCSNYKKKHYWSLSYLSLNFFFLFVMVLLVIRLCTSLIMDLVRGDMYRRFTVVVCRLYDELIGLMMMISAIIIVRGC